MKITDVKENQVVHCRTEEEAERICKLMHEAGMKWKSGESYINITHYNECQSGIYYNVKNGTYCDEEYFISHRYEIIPSERITSNELPTYDNQSLKNGISKLKKRCALLEKENEKLKKEAQIAFERDEMINSRVSSLERKVNEIITTKPDQTKEHNEFDLWYENEMAKSAENYLKQLENNKNKIYPQKPKSVDNLSTKDKENRQNLCNNSVAQKSDPQNVENQWVRDSSLKVTPNVTWLHIGYRLNLNKEKIDNLSEKIQLLADMTEYADRVNDGWVPDWSRSDLKWGIYYDNIKLFHSDWFSCGHGAQFVFGIVVKSKKLAEQMLSKFKDRIEKYY